ncbi:RDD family protein [Paenibacillus sp. R14(2021)]|uniref:RDD family protein n=1 Tax=Paenibacillus sp. R14(2021) TaxID=2859228 RepID=UPI001C611A31|nr:RDD family protein [Paenibacillus sp. R14(2021)]
MIEIQFQYVGFWKRLIITFIEMLVMSIPLTIIYRLSVYLAEALGYGPISLIHWLVFFIFDITLLVKFGGTLGKLIFKIRVVNRNGKYLNVKQALTRYIFILAYGVILSVEEYFSYLNVEAPDVITQISLFYGLVFIIDSFTIIFNNKKRAIHDFMAGSYVVTKKSLDI